MNSHTEDNNTDAQELSYNNLNASGSDGGLKHICPSPNGGVARHAQRAGVELLAIRRADRFSPNNVANDRAILEAAVNKLRQLTGEDIPIVDEEQYCGHPVSARIFLTMGRLPETIGLLRVMEQKGSTVINSTRGVELCSHRSRLDSLMRKNGIAMPPEKGDHGYWLKRGDSSAQTKDDIVYCPNEEALTKAKAGFAARGITDTVVSTHVVGDLIKFYGVGGMMFHYFYTNDGGRSKFGNERVNGAEHHYPFNAAALREEVRRLSEITGVAVYGGDAVIDKAGNFYIIDFNDWPTFFNCREEAAEAITRLAIGQSPAYDKINDR